MMPAEASDVQHTDTPRHIPVLVEPLKEWIHLPKDGILVDATVGHGGHSAVFGRQLGPKGCLLGLDVDPNSIRRAAQTLRGLSCRVELIRENFDCISRLLAERGIDKVDCILADLGFCSGQLDDAERGLSFQTAMPLDMRLDDRLKTTAADLVNRLPQTELADLIYRYGQDRASRRIARFIVEQRQGRKFTTTAELAEVVCRALKAPARGQRIHPATRTFQALRIAVNDELTRLQTLLTAAPKLLKPGGIIAVISFHSLEDGMVKNDFRGHKSAGVYEVLTKKPIPPTDEEIAQNPRSRSAKLRVARRL